MNIEVVLGDIVEADVDVIVTAANSKLRGGGGVDGAVHRAAGVELLGALTDLGPCPAGSSVITPAFGLGPRVSHIIHAVGPRYGTDRPEGELLARAYQSALVLADSVGARSIAFPSISTGVYHFPALEAALISVRALRIQETRLERCVLVAFDAETERLWRLALG